ncbi:MAG: hypothetical protein IKQ81_03460 [Clostridiales bacterium]|nr:hypothetical protein [Clostridiales bacterium]
MVASKKRKNYMKLNKEVFLAVIKIKGKSIRALDQIEFHNNKYICSERTIRRALHNKKIDSRILDDLGRYMDVDPRYLSGSPELYPRMYSTLDDYLADIDFYPYSREAFDNAKKQYVKEWARQLLPRFNISFSQFDAKTIVEQNAFELKLVNSIMGVIRDSFDVDVYGDPEMKTMYEDVREWENDLSEIEYAETELRPKYTQNTPEGLTLEDITNMSSRELIVLDMENQAFENRSDNESELSQEYKQKFPIIN